MADRKWTVEPEGRLIDEIETEVKHTVMCYFCSRIEEDDCEEYEFLNDLESRGWRMVRYGNSPAECRAACPKCAEYVVD
jgi:hypothetical protein